MSGKLRIRMYNVGFGDCFLISIPKPAPGRTILVDAGFHFQGKGDFSSKQLAARVLADVEELVGRRRIDVVIGTHRHQDHITCFNAKEWDELEVGEVWLPWVDNPKDAKARKLWKKTEAFAATLHAAVAAAPPDDKTRAEIEFMLWNAGVPIEGMDFGASNLTALQKLRTGFASRDRDEPRYLPETSSFPETFETPVLPGVTVHVLGPPRDPDKMTEEDPREAGESYRELALLATGRATIDPERGFVARPLFDDEWLVKDGEKDGPTPALDDDDRARVIEMACNLDPLLAAHKLDGMINATSLVLLLKIGKARLLLPGDAEWGTWKLILGKPEATALVEDTTFLKVGHHGSHNATPKSLVEHHLREGIRAMISTQKGAGTFRNKIPLDELLAALKQRDVECVRSDKHPAEFRRGFRADTSCVDLELPY